MRCPAVSRPQINRSLPFLRLQIWGFRRARHSACAAAYFGPSGSLISAEGDLYRWLTYRLFTFDALLRLTWQQTYRQFGAHPGQTHKKARENGLCGGGGPSLWWRTGGQVSMTSLMVILASTTTLDARSNASPFTNPGAMRIESRNPCVAQLRLSCSGRGRCPRRAPR